MDPARRTAARVQGEAIALLVLVEDPVHVPVAVEHAPAEHRMEFARDLPNPFEQVRRDPLRAELSHKAVVVDGAPDLPWGDDEVLVPHWSPESGGRDKTYGVEASSCAGLTLRIATHVLGRIGFPTARLPIF